MISEKDIKKLADLARIEIKEEEQKELAKEIDQILDYVKLVSQFHSDSTSESGQGEVINVMREDKNPTESGTYSKELIEEFPDKKGNYLKVKKIL